MGWGGAPPWVYKNEIANLQSENCNNLSENNKLKDRIKELEDENARLRSELEECKKGLRSKKPKKA